MAGIKISALPAVASALTTDFFPVVQAGVTSRETLAQVQTLFGFGGGILDLAHGGTSANLTASNGAVPYSSATAIALLAAGTSGQIFQSGGVGSPNWTTATYPSTVPVSRILYASTNNVVDTLATVNRSVLATTNVGVPQWQPMIDGQLIIGSSAAYPGANTLTAGVGINILNGSNSITISNNLSTYTTTATAAATTTLTATSSYQQYFTGVTTQTVTLPLTSTLVLGQGFYIVNNSSGVVTVQSSGGNVIQAMAANTNLLVTCILTSGATAASWNAIYEVSTGPTFPLSLSNGGTNAALTASNGGIFYSSSTAGAILSGTATAGLALLSGASTTPSWSTAPPLTKVNIQTFTVGTSTYTPTSGMKFATVEIVGAGGSGGAVTGGTAAQASAAGGGGGGGYCRKTYTAVQIGATATVVVGAGGTLAAAGANNGSAGANSTFTCTGAGATLTASGGSAGNAMSKSASAQASAGGAGGSATNGDLNIPGSNGGNGNTQAAGASAFDGVGGSSYFSAPTPPQMLTTSNNNNTAPTSYGGGSSGACDIATADTASIAGASGICYITEYVSV